MQNADNTHMEAGVAFSLNSAFLNSEASSILRKRVVWVTVEPTLAGFG
jgi:hypothetical protein